MHTVIWIFNALFQSVWPYALDNSFSDISLKSLLLTKGAAYVQQLRDTKQSTIKLPKVQFEVAQRAEQLPLELRRKLKIDYLSTDDLRTRWAQSYVACRSLKDTTPLLKNCGNPAGYNLAFAPSGVLAASYPCHKSIVLWQPKRDAKPLDTIAIDMIPDCIAWTNDSALAAGHDDTLSLWNVNTRQRIVYMQNIGFSRMFKIMPHSDKQIFSLSMYNRNDRYGERVLCWRPQDNSCVEFASKSVYEAAPRSCALSPDGITCAIGNNNGGIELWDLRRAQCFATCAYPFSDKIDSVEFLTPTLVAATSSRCSVVCLYDVTKREKVREIRVEDSSQIHDMCRINETTLGVVTWGLNSDTEFKIIDTECGVLHSMKLPMMTSKRPFASGPRALLATAGPTEREIVIYRPTLPAVPDNIDAIPFDAYALASQQGMIKRRDSFADASVAKKHMNIKPLNSED